MSQDQKDAYLPLPSLLDGGAEPLAPRRQRHWILALLLIGILARCARYFLCFPLWDDECFLCFNLIDGNYAELLQPLQFHQVAPWLFLWVQSTLTRLFGFSEMTLRLFPFLCSIASLFLFRALAQRLLKGMALVLAIGIFAVAYPGIRYAGEAKQYAIDLCVSLVLLNLAVQWLQQPKRLRQLWLLAAILPLAANLSYPSVFIAGGISLAIAYQLWRARQHEGRIAWVVVNASLLLGFGLMYFLSARHQSSGSLAWMQDYWQLNFPPLGEWSQIPKWLLLTHSGAMFAYPIGADHGGSAFTLVCLVVAVIALFRSRRTDLLLIFLMPLGLHLLAACLRRYPYGGHVKFSQYLAPVICALMGLGMATMIGWWKSRPTFARRSLLAWLVLLCLIGVGSIARDIARPYKTTADMRIRAFSRWFWFNMEHEGEVVCARADLGKVFSPETYKQLSYAAMYHCNMHIYSPRHRSRQKPQWHKVSALHPLRCARFRSPRFPEDKNALEQWLNEMRKTYDLVSMDELPFPRYDKRETRLINMSYIEVYKFVPKQTVSHEERY